MGRVPSQAVQLVLDKLTDPGRGEAGPRRSSPRISATVPSTGELRLDKLQVTLIFTGDEAAHARVKEFSRDTVALVQEHMIPIPFVFVKTHTDQLTHLARTGGPETTLCGREVRRTVNVSQADRCPDCARLATEG